MEGDDQAVIKTLKKRGQSVLIRNLSFLKQSLENEADGAVHPRVRILESQLRYLFENHQSPHQETLNLLQHKIWVFLQEIEALSQQGLIDSTIQDSYL